MPINSRDAGGKPYQNIQYENKTENVSMHLISRDAGRPCPNIENKNNTSLCSASPLVVAGVHATPATPRYVTWARGKSDKEKGDVEDLRYEVDDLVMKNKNLEHKLIERDRELARVNCKLKKQNSILRSKEQELVSYREKQTKLQKQLNNLTNRRCMNQDAANNEDIRNRLEEKVEDLTRQLEEMDSTMNCWQEENELRKQDLVATQQRLEATYEEMDEMSYNLKRYKAELKKLKKENTELKTSLYEMECEQAKDKCMNNKLREKVEKLLDHEEELLIENEALHNKLEKVLAELNQRKQMEKRNYLMRGDSYSMTEMGKQHSRDLEAQDEEMSLISEEDYPEPPKPLKKRSLPQPQPQPTKSKVAGRKFKKSVMRMQSKRCIKIKNNPKQLNERRTVMFTVYPPSNTLNVVKRYRKGGNVGLVCKKGPSRRYFNSRGGKNIKVRNVCWQ